MRHFHKAWQDKRPGFTRRVRWYQGEHDIRLNFLDDNEGLEINRIYTDKTRAEQHYAWFIAGQISVRKLSGEK